MTKRLCSLLSLALAAGLTPLTTTIADETPRPAPPATPASMPTLADLQPAAARAKVRLSLPDWEQSPAALQASVDESIRRVDAALDKIGAQDRTKLNLDNTLRALDDETYPILKVANRVGLIEQTSTDKAMREKATELSKILSEWFVKTSFREDLYQVSKAYAASQPELEGEDKKLLQDTMRDYRRRGMDLDVQKRKQVEALQTELSNWGIEFQKNVNEAKTPVVFKGDELAGVPEDFLKKVKTGENEYTVDANITWQFINVMENASPEATRKRLKIARYSRAKDTNLALFANMLGNRRKIASLVGYDSWADYKIAPKMAKTAATASQFLERLRTGLQPKFDAELESLRTLKAKHTGNKDARIELWDMRYYLNQLKKTRYNVDTEQLRVFFRYENVLQGMFDIFQELFELKIQEIQAPYRWADGVTLYAISDAGTQAPLGLFYLDSFPRDGKYNHFAQFGITPGKLLPDGRYQRPVVAVVGNFPPASEDKPSLLTYDNVKTLFHEFGHALHSILTQARYTTFSGTSVPRDFVEAPSQMLENWVRDKEILDRFAFDYRDPSRKIPAPVLAKIEEARLGTIGSLYRRQLSFGIMDLALHTDPDGTAFANLAQATNAILSDVYVPVPPDTAFIAAFGHLAGGYDAGYYGYAWSDAISADMASVFKQSKGGLMDRAVGKRLREEIYAVGDSRDVNESIRIFLGRERSLDAFFQQIGLTDKPD